MSRIIAIGLVLGANCLLTLLLTLTSASSFAQTPASDAEGQKVLVTYGQEKMTFEEFARQQPAMVSWFGIGVTAKQVQQTLDNMVFNILSAKEANSTGLINDPDVKLQVDKILAAAYLQKRVPKDKIPIEEADIKAYYDANLDKYKSQELIKVSHILVKSLDEANKISGELDKGAKFSEIAAKRSIDSLSAKQDGLVGLLPPNQLLPELRTAIHDLPPGQVSKPIKTSLGYHLVRLDDRPQVTYRPFEELRKELFTEVLSNKEKEMILAVKDELWKKYNVTPNQESIEELIKSKTTGNVQVEAPVDTKQLRKPGEATDLQFVSETLNVGDMPAKKFSGSLLIANASDRELGIDRVGSTCPCLTVTSPQKLLKPGQVSKLDFTYDPDAVNDKGQVQRVIFIESTDRIEPRKFVRLNINVARK